VRILAGSLNNTGNADPPDWRPAARAFGQNFRFALKGGHRKNFDPAAGLDRTGNILCVRNWKI